MNAKQVLQNALLSLEKYGWGQGYLHNSATGKVCLMGAGYYAMLRTPDPSFENLLEESACGWDIRFSQFLGFRDSDQLINWNDAPSRKYEDVVERIKDAIARVEEQEKQTITAPSTSETDSNQCADDEFGERSEISSNFAGVS